MFMSWCGQWRWKSHASFKWTRIARILLCWLTFECSSIWWKAYISIQIYMSFNFSILGHIYNFNYLERVWKWKIPAICRNQLPSTVQSHKIHSRRNRGEGWGWGLRGLSPPFFLLSRFLISSSPPPFKWLPTPLRFESTCIF